MLVEEDRSFSLLGEDSKKHKKTVLTAEFWVPCQNNIWR